ncbi:MAG: ABC transporter permease [Acidobacteriota bacterium]
MIKSLKNLYKYRQLIVVLVSRELKAKYRGTVLGFFWSFMNPILLVTVYSIVFGLIFQPKYAEMEKQIYYSIFFFSGILPWTWFSSSILESSNVLIAHGALIKKINFPVEILPIMVVITNMIHFILGVPILIIAFLILGKSLSIWVLFLPIAILVQFIFTLGLGFFISSLTVHFRDIRDLLVNLITLWFFVTPIIYPFSFEPIQNSKFLKLFLSLNPMTHIIEAYQYTFFFGSLPHYKKLTVTLILGIILFIAGYKIFDKLRDTFVEEV